MARIIDPVLFSTYFGIPDSALAECELIDPFVDVDTPLFIDPVLLEKSSNPLIRKQGFESFRAHFSSFIRLLTISERQGDAAWKGARRLLDLSEPPENGLGYGGSGRSGSSRPEEVREAIMMTSKEIIELGANDPEMVSLMGFFEENVGPDTISDFTTQVIIKQLAEITEAFCLAHEIEVHENEIVENFRLPKFTGTNGREVYLVLVPRDLVRELPIANDWSDIEKAAFENHKIRDRVNSMLSAIAKPTIADRKTALRQIALESRETFDEFLQAVKEHVSTYDPNTDALGYYRLKAILANGMEGLARKDAYDLGVGPKQVELLVLDAIEHFKRHVENGNLWEELWIDDKPKKERAAQLLFYAIAECFCRANNVDISPEANMGGGPVDFKFSVGFDARVLVEIKRSSGTVRHGYERQLEIYKDASRTQYGIFVVMNFGDLGEKLTQIEAIRDARIEAGEPASKIIVIDASKKKSASKRK